MQRCALAVALALNPDILLLDGKTFIIIIIKNIIILKHSLLIEPTSALDPESIKLVENTLKSKTCIWISHDPGQQERVGTHTLTLTRSHAPTPSDSVKSQDTDSNSSATTVQM